MLQNYENGHFTLTLYLNIDKDYAGSQNEGLHLLHKKGKNGDEKTQICKNGYVTLISILTGIMWGGVLSKFS